MKNSEILEEIIKALEDNHLNLYHSIDKEVIVKYVSSLKNIDDLTNVEFDYKMLKLFALFKDAHTLYFVPYKALNKYIGFYEGKLLLKEDNEFKEIISIGELSISEFLIKMSEMMAYETQEWLNNCIRNRANNGYFYEMLKLADNEKIKFVIKDSNGTKKDVYVDIVPYEIAKENGLIPNQPPIYSYKVLEEDILCVKYSACQEIKDYPFSKFVEDIKKEIENKNITNYILDLRGNNGGNSEILNPFQDLVAEKQLKGVLLINNGVFSSGRFAVARFKKQFNTPLIGEGTGGAAKSYGYNKNLQVGDKKFSVSIRLWDFSDVFGYEGSIQPDIYVPTTILDLQNNKDAKLERAIKYLKNENIAENDIHNEI